MMWYDVSLFIAGMVAWPFLKLIGWVIYCLKWAFKDTWRVATKGELQDGYSKWNWFIIIPRVFFSTLWETATSIGTRVS